MQIEEYDWYTFERDGIMYAKALEAAEPIEYKAHFMEIDTIYPGDTVRLVKKCLIGREWWNYIPEFDDPSILTKYTFEDILQPNILK